MVKVRLLNKTGKPLELVVEPWASTESIAAGSAFAIYYPAPTDRDDTSYAEFRDGLIIFWCEGETYEVDVDGARILT
jgi:hypothetical protein